MLNNTDRLPALGYLARLFAVGAAVMFLRELTVREKDRVHRHTRRRIVQRLHGTTTSGFPYPLRRSAACEPLGDFAIVASLRLEHSPLPAKHRRRTVERPPSRWPVECQFRNVVAGLRNVVAGLRHEGGAPTE